MLTNLVAMPAQIVQGTTVSFIKTLRDYDPSLFILRYHLRGPAQLDVEATDNGDGSFLVQFVASSGDPLTPLPDGKYFYQAYAQDVSNSSDRRFVENGNVEVLVDLALVTTAYDGRSKAEIMVEAIDAVLQKKASTDQASYTIGQRTLVRIPPDQLLKWRDYYQGIVNAEVMAKRISEGKSPFTNILTQFKRP